MNRLHYNSPVVLTLFLASLCALVLGLLSGGWTTTHLFSVYRAPVTPLFFVRLFGHVLGHSSFAHFSGNMVLLLVVGPPMEEKFGSKALLLAVALTALLSGVLQCLFFPGTALLGASGVVFMLILLSSLSGMRSGTIPLTFVLVAVLYLGQEVYSALFVQDGVAHFMHLVGGACGTCFGYLAGRDRGA